jgi:hypothetical protein
MTAPIAEFRGSSGWMTVDLAGTDYVFRIGGRTRTLIISDEEAVALANAILERSRCRR